MARYMNRSYEVPFPDREREREREKRYYERGGYDSQLAVYSPSGHNSLTSIAPGYGGAYGNPHSSSGALIRGSNLIEEPVVEHEHHHVHHHIDHGII